MTHPVELARLFIEALNARDLDALQSSSPTTSNFETPRCDRSLRGRDGIERIAQAARDAGIVILRHGREDLASEDGAVRIATPVRAYRDAGPCVSRRRSLT